MNNYLTEKERKALIDALISKLPTIRARAHLSQDDVAKAIGVSRQTYGNIERRSHHMLWNTYLSLILFFDYNKKTHDFIRDISIFPYDLIKKMNDEDEDYTSDVDGLIKSLDENILATLDEQALATIKTVITMEYARCNKISVDATIKLFEGKNLFSEAISEQDKSTRKSLRKIKERNK